MQIARAGTVRRAALVVSCRHRRSPQGPRAPHVPHGLADLTVPPACRRLVDAVDPRIGPPRRLLASLPRGRSPHASRCKRRSAVISSSPTCGTPFASTC